MAQTDDKTGAVPTTARWVKIVLALSLGLNILIIGAAVGAIWRTGAMPVARSGDVALIPLIQALPEEERRTLQNDLRVSMRPHMENRNNMRQINDALLAAMRADPFVPERVNEVITSQSALARARLDVGREVLINRLTGMTPEARGIYADRLEDELRKGPRHKPRREDRRGREARP